MTHKTYIGAQQLLEMSFALGDQVIASGLKPTQIVGVWRGGSSIGIAVQELFEFRGLECDHSAIRTSS